MPASFAFSSIAARQYQPIMAAISSKDNHNCATDGNQVTGIQNDHRVLSRQEAVERNGVIENNSKALSGVLGVQVPLGWNARRSFTSYVCSLPGAPKRKAHPLGCGWAFRKDFVESPFPLTGAAIISQSV
jgi:hypothetical protein